MLSQANPPQDCRLFGYLPVFHIALCHPFFCTSLTWMLGDKKKGGVVVVGGILKLNVNKKKSAEKEHVCSVKLLHRKTSDCKVQATLLNVNRRIFYWPRLVSLPVTYERWEEHGVRGHMLQLLLEAPPPAAYRYSSDFLISFLLVHSGIYVIVTVGPSVFTLEVLSNY